MTTAKYILIAKKIISDVDDGHLQINSQLPSLRMFSKLHSISMTTAIACYRYLEKSGYAVSEEKKGFYIQQPLALSTHIDFPKFTTRISTLFTRPQAEIELNETDSCSFGTAQIDEPLVDYQMLKRSIRAATKLSDFNVNYDQIQGNIRLRTVLSKLIAKQGLPNSVSDLTITYGCLDAVLIALECVSNPDDVIAVCSPCYSGLLDILSVLNRSILEIPSTENGLDLQQLEQAIKVGKVKACLLTANYQNPTGHSITYQQKQTIAQLANTYQIPIIEDDVYRELSHQRETPLPIKYFDEGDWVIWCSSISKTLAPGFRVGWCLPGRYKAQFIQQRKIRTLGHNTPIQLALADHISSGYYQTHLKKVNRALSSHCHFYLTYLKHKLPKNANILTPAGGLVLWINIPNLNADSLSMKLAKTGVYIKSGNLFSTTDMYRDCFRINLGKIPTPKTIEQLDILCNLINETMKQ